MKNNFCKNKYRLELHWDGITYLNDKVAVLSNARFSGPALKEAAKLNAPDFIDLDLTEQLVDLLTTYYIIRLSWESVSYMEDGTVLLQTATFGNKELREFHKVLKDDYLLIDTEKHQEHLHPFNLVYACKIIRPDHNAYLYKEK
jgi:hypothetical protein